jgi:hypothetical protein
MADGVTAVLNFTLRRHQLSAYAERQRFNVRVFHRRAGKTYLSCAELLKGACATDRPDWRGFYLAPTHKAAKAISFDYFKRFTNQLPGVETNESELRINFANGSQIQLLGAEAYDALRGRYADHVVLDETAQIPAAAWHQVLSPMLADRLGRADFIGTPMGRQNLFHELWTYAPSDPDWGRILLTHSDTNCIDPGEIDRMRRAMRPEVFAQELECSWNAALTGAFYAEQMAAADSRIIPLLHDPTYPVYAALDLGWSDAMAIVAWQTVAGQHRILHASQHVATTIPELVSHLRGLAYPIASVVLPHDARVHELGTGLSRQEVFHQLGCNTSICPNIDVHEGIAMVRDMLPMCWFNQPETATLVEALNAYRSSFDEVRQVHARAPLHDWSSHFADAVRYMAVGRPSEGGWSKRPEYKLAGVYS